MKNSSVIDRNGRYLLALINSILDQAQLEAGQVRIVTQPESVRALVEDVVATLKPLVRDKPVTLDAEFASGMPDMVEIDAFRVRQILLNLTGNGIKFTPQGQVRIEVSWHDSRLSISVKDTGPGLSVQAQSRLFTAFAQADDSIAAKHGGTGLGLTISRDLARLTHVEITMTSQLGVGSQFTLVLPAAAAQWAQSAAAASAPAEQITTREPTVRMPLSAPAPLADPLYPSDQHAASKPMQTEVAKPALRALYGTVLVAEDSPDLRALSVMHLKRPGLTVLEAVNGREAVDLALSGQPDAILMDLEMPVMSGLEAVKHLREVGFSRPILATTAHTGEPHLTLALAAGCNDMLSKPISFAILRAALDGAMGARLLSQPDLTSLEEK